MLPSACLGWLIDHLRTAPDEFVGLPYSKFATSENSKVRTNSQIFFYLFVVILYRGRTLESRSETRLDTISCANSPVPYMDEEH
jgi:hypothetical protein